MAVFWDIALCTLVDIDQCFRGAYCVHHQVLDDGGSKYLCNVSQHVSDYMAQCPRRQPSSHFILSERD
jgi:hypothetical protein